MYEFHTFQVIYFVPVLYIISNDFPQ